MAELDDEHVDENEDWREGLLKRVRTLLCAILAFSVFLVVTVSVSDEMRLLGIFVMVVTLSLVVLLSIQRISLAVRATVTTIGMSVAALVAYFVGGFLAGPALSIAYALLLAALLLGRRTFVILLTVFGLLPITAALLLYSGAWRGPSSSDFDPSNPVTWIRTGIISVAIWTAIGLSVLFVKNAIERNLARRERALAEKNEALYQLQEEVVNRRAAEEARQQAEQMAAQAQKLDAVGRLAAGIAHDFNNALLVIQSWNELRSEPSNDVDVNEAKEAIERAVEHGAHLTRQLLAFGRKDVRSPRYFAIDDVVEDNVKTLRRLLPADIALLVDTRSNLAVFADSSQLQQILFNLAINARDALPDGGEIRIRTRQSNRPERLAVDVPVADDVPWVVLQVEDNGAGMDKDTQDVAFEPFFTTKDIDQGAGLGLSTVFGIVRQSDGHIELQSEPGQGTTVTIYLPGASRSLIRSESAATSEESGDVSTRILLVDDDPLVLKPIVRTLERNGMQVVACNDGDTAMHALVETDQRFDVLCCDAFFSGASLSDVVRSFQRHSPDAPILVCSGYVREQIAITGVESGEWEYLAKPFSKNDLIERIRSVVSKSGRAPVSP